MTLRSGLALFRHHRQLTSRLSARLGRSEAEDHAGDDAAVKHLDFEEDEIPGELQRPGIALVTGSPRDQKLGSLIEIPVSFEPSMTKMIEDM